MIDLWPLFVLLCALLLTGVVLTLLDWRWGTLALAAALPFEGVLPEVGASGMKALTAVVLFALALHLARDRPLRDELAVQCRTNVSVCLLAIIVLAAISALWATSPAAALLRASTFAGVFVLMQLFALLDRRFVRRALTLLLASAAVSVPVGLTFAGFGGVGDESRFTSGGLNANDYGGLLVVALLASGWRAARGGILGVALAVVVLAGILASGSRTAFVALALAPIVALVLAPAPRRGGTLARVAVAYAVVAGVAGGLYALDPSRAEAWQSRAMTLANYRDEQTWVGRLEIWRGGVEMVRAHPLRGTGAGNFPIDALRQPGMPQNAAAGRPGPVAHNMFLGITAELGVAGLVLFAWMLMAGLRRARHIARHDPLGVGLLAGLAAFALLGMALSWEYAKAGYLLLGCTLALNPARHLSREPT
jgi:O-antigen ligase